MLRPEREPEVTRVVAAELTGKHARAGASILAAVGLPLERGMDRRAIERALGKAKKVYSFVADRETLEFRVGSRDRAYLVSCTVEKKDGLTYVVVRNRGRAKRSRARSRAH
jgi:hypothetical protein